MCLIITKSLTLLTMAFGATSAFAPNPFGARKLTAVNRGLFGLVDGGADHFDMNELKQRIAQETNPFHELFNMPEVDAKDKPMDVHVIIFNPDTESEGMHSIEYPKGSGNNLILAFESKQECDSFASLLKEQKFFDPSPKEVFLEELEAYCDELGVFVQIVPKGVHIAPPPARVETLGHNPQLRVQQSMLDYLFEMSEVESEEEGVLEGDFGGSWE